MDKSVLRHVLVPSVSIDRLARAEGIDSHEATRIYSEAAIEQALAGSKELVEEVKSEVVNVCAEAVRNLAGVDFVLPGPTDLTLLYGGRTYQVSIKQLNK